MRNTSARTAATMTPVSPENPYKRHIDAVQRVYECTNRWKAQRLDEEPATPSAHDDSAPVPENVPEHNAETGPTENDTDASSELSESSEEPSSDSSEDDGSEGEEESGHDEEEVVNLRANRGTKPDYKLSGDEEDIRPFLKDFLPKLKAANEELEAQKKAGKLQSTEITGEDDEEAKGEYIEMVSSRLAGILQIQSP